MAIESTLTKLGLSQKEIDVYLTSLQLGPSTITEISKKSSIKRPTCYLVIESLLKRGLVSIVRRHAKNLYAAERPRKILSLLKAQERELEKSLPELEALYNSPKYKPKVVVYEGIEGIRTIYDEIYSSLSKNEEVVFITSISDLVKHDPVSIDLFTDRLARVKKFKIRELNMKDELCLKYIEENKNKRGPDHHIKLSNSKFPFYNDTVLYGNKVVFFSLKKEIFATAIESEEISTTVKSLFEMAWQVGEKID